jgi:hypothetical protein
MPFSESKTASHASSEDDRTVVIINSVSEETIRNREYGDSPYLIPGLLYIGATVVYAEGGLGKTTFCHAMEHHLAFQTPFGGWVPDERHRCLIVSFEDDERQVWERSLKITPHGTLTTDGDTATTESPDFVGAIHNVFHVAGDDFDRRLDNLRIFLEQEEDAGRGFSYVRIDTYMDFAGAKPRDMNAYEWDKHCATRLNKLALRMGIAIVIVHHTNKAGDFSGSEGLRGGVTTLAVLEKSEEQPETEAVLRSRKCRVAANFSYTLTKRADGAWEFTDDVRPTEAQLQGVARGLYAALVKFGPQTRAELTSRMTDVNDNTLRITLQRMKKKGLVNFLQNRWQVTQAGMQEGVLPKRCRRDGCPEPLLEDLYGDGYHAGCAPVRASAVPSPAPPPPSETAPEGDVDLAVTEVEEEQLEKRAGKEGVKAALKALNDSIDRSRMKPLRRVPVGERELAPWTLMQERADGAHRWMADSIPETGFITIVDRTGSFPSACSSVPVAANALQHTGPLVREERKGLAGLWQIEVPVWESSAIGHPLGRLGAAQEPVWVTSSHLEVLDKLADAGDIAPVTVLDSWAGKRSTSLFERFSDWSRRVYAMDESPERDAQKAGVSIAMRLLWRKTDTAKSPFWRPDWNLAIRAESSVRHWLTARKAAVMAEGLDHQLVALKQVDEAVFWTPEQPAEGWVPAPYLLGSKFGHVKVKSVTSVEEWNRGQRKR